MISKQEISYGKNKKIRENIFMKKDIDFFFFK